jgi:hypothetical protein
VASKVEKTAEALMERLFSQKNIERYRRMLANPRDDAQRRVILKLLAEEEATLKEPQANDMT